MTILVTGGAGFIGSNFVLDWLASSDEPVVNVDKLTYAGNMENLASLDGDQRHIFVHGDIGDAALISRLLVEHKPRAVLNFAAESHVDRSIHGPEDFIQTNIVGTFHLLEAVRAYWNARSSDTDRNAFRFLHVSTDEVYGSLSKTDPAFSETNRYEPNSPYSASKAASDHLVRAYHHTYGLAGTNHKLLEQLRAVPLSRKTDSAMHLECTARKRPAHLRRRPANSRLAICKGPLQRHSTCAGSWQAG